MGRQYGSASISLIFFTLLGTGLASAAAGTLNNYIDRDIDQRMARTRNRALPAERLRPQQALWFGALLSIAAYIILYYAANALTAWLTMLTIFFYVVIYTIWLKRNSSCVPKSAESQAHYHQSLVGRQLPMKLLGQRSFYSP